MSAQSDNRLSKLLAQCSVVDIAELPLQLRRNHPIYAHGCEYNFAALMLQGKVEIEIGTEVRMSCATLIAVLKS